MKNFSNNFEENFNESILNKKTSKYIAIFIAIITLLLFINLAKNAYKFNTFPSQISEISLYRSELTPYRLKPSDPGGEIYNNQDKLVYNQLIEKNKKKKAQKRKIATKPKKAKRKNPFEFISSE